MKRSIETWGKCDPRYMVDGQSKIACRYALEDAKADLLEMHRDLLRFRNIARAIAYPERGTPEEGYNLRDFAKLLQSAYTAEDLWVKPEDR